MNPRFYRASLLLAIFWVLGLETARAQEGEPAGCGSAQLVCGQEERCCEHTVATFSNDGASLPSYVEGKCLPKELSCGDYWCGNRHCGSGFFGTPTVCCVNNTPGALTQYACAYSELSCPGNTQQVSIRTSSLASGKVRGY